MKKILSKMLGGALLFGLTMSLTSCEDILGHWEKPTPNPITPGGGSEGGGGSSTATYTMAADAAVGDLGKLICTDGHIHADGADAECTKDRVALICYVGNDAETSTTYNHGLALALSDASGYQIWCTQNTAICLGTGHQFSTVDAAKTDMAGIANTDALVGTTPHNHGDNAAKAAREYNGGTHPSGTSAWFLPSAGQWDKMITTAGDYATLKTNANLQNSKYYSSSTEKDANGAWDFYSNDCNWYGGGKESSSYTVRACLAF